MSTGASCLRGDRSPCASSTGRRSTKTSRPEGAHAGRALHGLRHPVLPHRLPAREPHPGVERPRLPRRLARGERAPARHQQLPRVHRPAVPGAVRSGVRARDQRAAGHDQADRGRDRRPRVGRGLDRPDHPGPAHGQAGRGGRLGPGRSGGRAAAHPRGSRRDRLRARRPRRRAAALRHPRVQDGEAAPRTARRADDRRGHGVPRQRQRRCRRAGERARRLRCGGARGRATAWRDLPVPGRELEASTRRCSTCRRRTACRRATSTESPISAAGQARGDHRGRRHRRRLPGHRASARARRSIHQFEILPRPPDARVDSMPWPT